MRTTVAVRRLSSTCTTIAVSERAPSLSPPPSLRFSSPLRESEPSTRMFSAPLGRAAAGTADVAEEACGTALKGLK